MGRIECPTHGTQGMAFLSLELDRLSDSGAALGVEHIELVRFTMADEEQYPPARAWFDEAAAAPFAGRVLAADEFFALELAPRCAACWNETLERVGFDSYSGEERRFMALRDSLTSSLRPRLEPQLRRLSSAWLLGHHSPSGWGFETLTGRPFVAYAGCPAFRVRVEVHDRGDHLEGSGETHGLHLGDLPPLVRVPLVEARLVAEAQALVTAWGDQLAGFFAGIVTTSP